MSPVSVSVAPVSASVAHVSANPSPVVATNNPGVTMDSVLRAEGMLHKAYQFETQLQRQDLIDERKRRSFVIGVVLSVLVGIVAYFVTSVYGMKMRYPHLFAWYEAMRNEAVQGRGKHNFGLYQVCVSADYQIAARMLNMLFIWQGYLRQPAANFLMYSIEYFEKWHSQYPHNRSKLTALHWAGSRQQTSFDKLFGPNGWVSTGCSTGTLEEQKETLIANWNRGRDENIWYYMLPQPVDETSKRAFLSVPMIAELLSDSTKTGGAPSACSLKDSDTFAFGAKIGQLFDGGLCNVADLATSANQAAADLFNECFATHDDATPRPSCKGAVSAAATSGSMSGVMTGIMLGQSIEGKSAIFLSTIIMGALGGVTSAAAANQRCNADGGSV